VGGGRGEGGGEKPVYKERIRRGRIGRGKDGGWKVGEGERREWSWELE